MNKLRTLPFNYRHSQLRYAVAILVGYGVGGFCLAGCEAGMPVRAIIHLLIAYIAITGKGGVVLSGACFSSMLSIYTFVRPWPLLHSAPFSLNPAQPWAFALLVLWGMGILLIDLLSSAVQEFDYWPKWQCAVLLGSLSVIALEIGHRVFETVITA